MVMPDPATVIEAGHHTGWQPMQIDVSGPAEAIALFREAARGPGAVPWAIDSAGDRQDLLARLTAQREQAVVVLRAQRTVDMSPGPAGRP